MDYCPNLHFFRQNEKEFESKSWSPAPVSVPTSNTKLKIPISISSLTHRSNYFPQQNGMAFDSFVNWLSPSAIKWSFVIFCMLTSPLKLEFFFHLATNTALSASAAIRPQNSIFMSWKSFKRKKTSKIKRKKSIRGEKSELEQKKQI